MRKIYSTSFISISASWLIGLSAFAQSNNNNLGDPGTLLIPSNSSSYNQQGFNLPSAPRSTGQDIVRGSGGVSCQSAVGGNGPVFDMGVIGTNDIYSRESTALYGRITVPLGKKPKRVDCSKLYDLEIQRLKMELQLMRAGGFGNFSDRQGVRSVMMQAQSRQPSTKTAAEAVVEEHAAPEPEAFTIPAPSASNTVTPQPKKTPAKPAKPIKIASIAPMGSVIAAAISHTAASDMPQTRDTPQQAKLIAPLPAVTSKRAVRAVSMEKVYLEQNGDPSAIRQENKSLYLTQLGAFSTLSNSKKAWAEYKTQVPQNISNFNAVVKPINRNGKTLYLLRIGPFDKATSKKVCSSVDGGCYPVKL